MTQQQEMMQLFNSINGNTPADCELTRKFKPAYVITNEDLHTVQKYIPFPCKNALVVAASGDHPLFCKLYGAENITTFDMTYNAKLIMDIKIAALNELNIGEYWNLLRSLYNNRDILSVKNMDRITPKLDPIDQEYIAKANKKLPLPIFSSGANVDSYMKHALMPTEYKKLQEMNLKPLPFIWSDIANIDAQIEDTYDMIHISNIFDYLKYETIVNVLLNMLRSLNVGGCLFIGQQNSNHPEYLCKSVVRQSKDWSLLASGRLNVLQRVR